MATVYNGGYRFSDNVADSIIGKRAVASREELVNATKLVDNGNKYLNEKELIKGADLIEASERDPVTMRELLGASREEFRNMTRAEVARPGALGLPQLDALAFTKADRAASGPISRTTAKNDKRIDKVAHDVARRVRSLGWKAKVVGANRKQTDVLSGIIPRAYESSGGRTFGEVYAVLELDIPGMGESYIALMETRQANFWNTGEYVAPESELFMAYLDEASYKSWGSGHGLDDKILRVRSRGVDAAVKDLGHDIVADLVRVQMLNVDFDPPASYHDYLWWT